MTNSCSGRPPVAEMYAIRHDNRTLLRVELCLFGLVEGMKISLISGPGY